MAGEDYSIKTKVEADVTNFEKGMNKAEKSLKGFSKNLADSINRLGKKGLIGSIANVTLAMGGLTKSLGTVVRFAKDVGKAVNECTEAYKQQAIAERALDTAISNNPFVTGASSKALKEFASEMQKVSNYGDEQLLPMLTNLISLGRTETETMQIMSVAMDMSAGMGISLDTAINQLNATLNGNIGRLGQQNAELKGLTEEELRSGRAIEILGEKFKGLAGATADTSKQLKNIRGDFKEALGQFTLPSSDMWNRFWAGFYENGIKVINKFNDYLDASIIGKNIAKQMSANADIVASAQGVSREDVLSDFRYIKEQLKLLNDEELKAYNNYLQNLKTRTQGEERMLTVTKQILQSRGLQEVQDRKDAEASARKAKLQEEELKREKELADVRDKGLKLQEEWQDKLFAIRIENLERQRQIELDNEELTQEQKVSIDNYYADMILEMKLQQLGKEREKALQEEDLTEEARFAVNLYYDNRITQVKQDEAKKRIKIKKEEVKNEEKVQKKSFAEMVSMAKDYTKKLADTLKKVASTIKNVFSKITNIFSGMFDISLDDALDTLLFFEDRVLTFFVETLPNLPNFLKSVVQSVKVLLKNLKAIVKREDVARIIFEMLKTIGNNLPEMISDLLDILENLIDGAIEGLVKWFDGGGLVTLLNLIIKIQQTIERIVVDNLEAIADLLAEHVQDFADFLAESMASANRTLPKLIKAVLKIVIALIDALAKAFQNEDFLNSIVESIEGVIQAIIDMLPKLITSIIKLIFAIITGIIPKLPEIIMTVVNAIIQAIPTILSDIVKATGEIFSMIFKQVFTADFWIEMLKGLGEAIPSILTGGLAGGSRGGGGRDLLDFLNPISSPLSPWNWFANGSQSVPRGLAVVGEAGPELVKFRGGEQVLNNRNTNKAFAEMGGKTINQNITFNNLQDTTAYAMMNQLKQYNRQMAINGVI